MKRVLTFLVIIQILALGTAYAIAPPKSGKIPKHLLPYFEQLSKEYNQGYWAEQMQRRAAMRATFGKSAQLMKIDTAFLPVLLGKYSNSTNYHSQAAFQAHLFDGPNPTGTLKIGRAHV